LGAVKKVCCCAKKEGGGLPWCFALCWGIIVGILRCCAGEGRVIYFSKLSGVISGWSLNVLRVYLFIKNQESLAILKF
jgi:hypothetical protein